MSMSTCDTQLLLAEYNLREVYPNLFISDMTIYKAVPILRSLNITNVLNLLSDEEDSDISEVYRMEGIGFMHLPMYDRHDFKLNSVLKRAIDYIDMQLRANRKILVHCFAGISRSPAIVIGYLMVKLGMTFDDALRQIGPFSHMNKGFVNQLLQIERDRSLRGKLTKACRIL